MKYFHSGLILTLVAAFSFATPLFAKDDIDNDRGKEGSKVYHIFSDIDLISARSYQYDKPRIVVRSVYPQLESFGDRINLNNFNLVVEDIIREEIAAFKKKTLELINYQQNMPKTAIKNELHIDYNASVIQSGREPIISIRFSMEGSIAGMAHPYHYHRSLNYNLRSGREISLDDLFSSNEDYLQVFSDYARKELSKHLQQNKDMIADGTKPLPENYKIWNIKPDGLLITFDEYQVAPYVYGAQTVLIPFSILKSMIPANSPIKGCVKNPKKCARSNSLTGGFVEAVDSHHRALNPAFS